MDRVRPELSPAGHDIPDSALTRVETHLKLGLVLMIAFTLYLWWGIVFTSQPANSIAQLDVGHADATLVTLTSPARDGHITILYDAGEGRAVLHALDGLGFTDRRIDLLIMSHPHLDHYGGFVHILERYDVGAFLTNSHTTDEETFQTLMRALTEREIPILVIGEGDRITYSEHTMDIVSPDERLLADGDLNEASVVALLETGAPADSVRILLTGDIGMPTEELLREKGYDLRADILKVGHHGSRFSSDEAFIAEVRPRVALIGVGQNRFGHPAPRVLETLELAGASIYRTDQDGTITVPLEHMGYSGGYTRHSTDSFLKRAWSLLTGTYSHSQTASVALYEEETRPFSLTPYQTCRFATDQEPRHAPVIINEVAWMGAPSGATHEWIELRNISGAPVDLSGWQLLNENERIHVTVPQQYILSDEYMLLARGGAREALDMHDALPFTGAIRNSNEGLRLFDTACTLIDEVLAQPTWSAGDTTTKQTAARTSALTWASSRSAGGTPGAPNEHEVLDRPSDTASHPSPEATPAPASQIQPTHVGCPPHGVDINNASPEELTRLRHIGVARARDIIAERPFSSVTDLARVRGLGGTRISDILEEGVACVR